MAVLVSSGFDNAILIDGGIDGWIRDGFRTVLPVDGRPEEIGTARRPLPGDPAR